MPQHTAATVFSALVAVYAAMPSVHAQIIANGGFEQPVISSNLNFNGTNVAISFTGWTGISAGNGGNAGLVFGTDFGLSPQAGSQHFSFNGNNPAAGTYLEQTFSTISGQSYIVDFWLGRSNGVFGQVLTVQADVLGSGDGLLATLSASPPNSISYSIATFNFTADATSTILRFTDISGSNPNTDLFLDTVAVTAIPEPTTAAIAIGAVVLACVVFQRSRRIIGGQNSSLVLALSTIEPGTQWVSDSTLAHANSCQKACFPCTMIHLRSCHREF